MHRSLIRILTAAAVSAVSCPVQAAASAALESLPALQVLPYMGTWYQVAYFPNVFQRQCVSDTTAVYRQREDGSVQVTNRCRTADGALDEATGLARPTGQIREGVLAPAQLEVSFLPTWLRWLPFGWGRYWVIQHAEDGRYAVVSEPTRQYLWVLSRTPSLSSADESTIRLRLAEQGFGMSVNWKAHPHRAGSAGAQ
jgi:apolipoprotein D and lipocalin family protein